MLKLFKQATHCFYQAGYCAVIKHDGIEHAGYLAYMSLLALFPFLVLIVAFAGFMGQGEAGEKFIMLLVNHLPPEAFDAIKPRVQEIMEGPPKGLVTVSILGAIWTSSGALEGMRTVLNRAYHVTTPPAYWLRRITSVVQLVVFTFIIIIGMIMLVFGPIFLEQIGAMFRYQLPTETEDNIFNLIFSSSLFLMFVVVSALYYVLPNIKLKIIDVVPGAVLTVSLWATAAYVFSLYLSNFNQVSLIYGSLGGIIATLIFFFIINVIFIFGAEINYQISKALGVRMEVKETENATPS